MDDLRLEFDPHFETLSARAALNHSDRVHLLTLIGACLAVDLACIYIASRIFV